MTKTDELWCLGSYVDCCLLKPVQCLCFIPCLAIDKCLPKDKKEKTPAASPDEKEIKSENPARDTIDQEPADEPPMRTQGIDATAPPEQWRGAPVERLEPVRDPTERSLPQKFLHASIGDTVAIAPGKKL